MQNGVSNDRQYHYDLLRIFSILCMMILHVAASNWYGVPVESFEWKWFNIYDSLVRFCVPVFVMISGVFFLNPNKEISLGVLLKKYVLRIVIAFLIWSFLYAFTKFFMDLIWGEGPQWSGLIKRIIVGHYHLWFLYMIVGLYLIVPFLKKITAYKYLTEFYLILWLVFSIIIPTAQSISLFSKISVITDKMQLNFVVGYSGYFILGYYLNNYKLNCRIEILAYVLGVSGILATILLTRHLSLIKGEPIGTYYGYLKLNVMFVAIAVFITFKQKISKYKFSKKSKAFITTISAYSFGMYLVHDFFNVLFLKFGFSTMLFNPILSVPLISLAVFLGSLCAIYVLSKIPIIGKYMT